jgi:hypothetical protein
MDLLQKPLLYDLATPKIHMNGKPNWGCLELGLSFIKSCLELNMDLGGAVDNLLNP